MKSRKITICYLSPKFKPFFAGSEISLERLMQGLSQDSKVYPLIITSLINKAGDLLAGEDRISKNIVRVGFDRNIKITESKKWGKVVSKKLVQKLSQYKDTIDVIYLNHHLFLQSPDSITKLFSLKKPVVLKIIYTKTFSLIR